MQLEKSNQQGAPTSKTQKKYKNIDSQSHTIWVGENAHKFCIFFFFLNPKHKFVYSSKRT